MKKLVLVWILVVICLSGCSMFKETLIVSENETATKITANVVFVTKTEFIELNNGKVIPYNNNYIGYYCLPADYITIDKENLTIKIREE